MCWSGGLLVQQLILFVKCSRNKYLFQGEFSLSRCLAKNILSECATSSKPIFKTEKLYFSSELLFFLQMRMSCKDLKALHFFKSLKAFCANILFFLFFWGGQYRKRNLRKYSAVLCISYSEVVSCNGIFSQVKMLLNLQHLFHVTQLGSKWKWVVNFMKRFLFDCWVSLTHF